MTTFQPRLNLAAASILLLEQSHLGLEVIFQILCGFGARNLRRTTSIEEAQGFAGTKPIDLYVVDPNLSAGDGLSFVKWVRRLDNEQNRTAPIIVTSANGSDEAVRNARDSGSNFFLVKPLSPESVGARLLMIMQDTRQFVVAETYVGPDRRIKNEGIPPGLSPRRSTDIQSAIGAATEANLSQDDLEAMFKPQKVQL